MTVPIQTSEGTFLGPEGLALRTKVSLAAFRLSWQWFQQCPEQYPESLAEEMAADADRCNDLKEMLV